LFWRYFVRQASVITGSIGLLASASLGTTNDLNQYTDLIHKLKGTLQTQRILSAAMLLEHFGLQKKLKNI
jgi:3-isopropylmalate dehydrogenase